MLWFEQSSAAGVAAQEVYIFIHLIQLDPFPQRECSQNYCRAERLGAD